MAILSAFNSRDDVEILGLTSLFGNVPTKLASANALRLVHIAGREDVPVVEGAHTSLRGVAKERIADFVHGDDGFGNTNNNNNNIDNSNGSLLPSLSPGSAAEFIVRMADTYPGEVTILALAALTNVALALQLDPQLAEKLHRVVVMLCEVFT